MFDLFRSRDKAVRYLLGALLGLVALSMVITLIPGYDGISAGSSQNPVIAKVGDDTVTSQEVRIVLQNAMRSRSFPPEMVQHYVPLLVNQIVTERALAYQAKRMGFEVSDAEVARALQSITAQYFPNGQFDRAVYESFVRQQNMTVEQFEDNVRKQMLLTRLQNLALEGVVVSPREIEEEFNRRNEKVKVDYVLLSPAKFRPQVNVTPAEVQSYFNANRPTYRIPEKRSFQMLVLDEAKIAASLNISDDELRKMYQQNLDRYRNPERAQVRHILIKTVGMSKEDQDKARAKIDDLLKQIKSGADFAALATKHSEDPGSAVKGGDLGWITRDGQTVKNFESAAFSLKPGQISDVISTEYGYHIIQVMEREQARVRPFEEVKAEIASESQKQMVYDRMQSTAEQARAALAKTPGQPQQVAQQFNLPLISAQNVSSGDPIQEIGINPDFENAISSTDKGQVTQVIPVAANKLAIAVVTDVQPSRPAELNEVESQVRERLIDQKARELMQQRAREAEQKLRESGGDLRKLGQSMGLEVKTTPEFTRDGTAEGIGSASYVLEAFSKPVGALVGPVNTGEQVIFVKVAEKIPADPTKLLSDRDTLVMGLKRKKAGERKELFEDGVLNQLIKEGKVKINEDAIKRLATSYRG
jgi:peptidyl-prolyl cis-trans isomerase D